MTSCDAHAKGVHVLKAYGVFPGAPLMLAMLLAACGPAVAPKHAVRADGGPTAPAKPASPSFADLPALSGLDAAVQSDFRSSSPLEPDAGRLTAAFEHARYCYHLKFRMQASRRMDESCQAAFKDGATTEAAEACRSRAMRMDVERAGLKEPFAGCAGDAKASRRYFEAARAAARAGNTEAQLCYLQGSFDDGDIRYSREDLDGYRQDAPRLIAEAMSRGDWRVVVLLARGRPVDTFELLSAITHDDLYEVYVMKRVLQKGAEPALAQRVERSIQVEYTLLNMQTREPMLLAERMAEGLAEAEAIYRRYFADGPLLKEPPVVCKSGFGSSAPWL